VVASGDKIGGIAVCTSRKKNSVERNRLKRIAREAMNSFASRLKSGVSVAVFPDGNFLKADHRERTIMAFEAFQAAGIIEGER